ncbi:hypothetical protein EOM09_08240 [bacterium]|nr:hypothetical protein [bacterium]
MKNDLSKLQNNTVITSVGNISSSSSIMLKTIKNILGTENKISIKPCSDISSSNVENLIIIDDFTGLGDAFIKDYMKNESRFQKFQKIDFIIPIGLLIM